MTSLKRVWARQPSQLSHSGSFLLLWPVINLQFVALGTIVGFLRITSLPASQVKTKVPHPKTGCLTQHIYFQTSPSRFAMADKIREKNQYALLKQKYPGIGNADTTRDEFLTTTYNDTIASLAHHKHINYYNLIVTNKHPNLMKQEMIKKIKLDATTSNGKRHDAIAKR